MQIMKYLYEKGDRSRIVLTKTRETFFDYSNAKIKAKLVALSPSNEAVTKSIANIASMKPEIDGSRLELSAPTSENLNAVAVHFTFGN